MTDLSAGPRRLHPISMVASGLKSLPGAAVGMIGAFSVLVQRNPGLAFGIALGVLAMVLAGSALGWWRFTYEVRAREIIIAKGLFARQRRVIPFDRVRDIAIERPLLARLVGTAKVRIETGGAKADEGSLDMIDMADALALRDRIRHASTAAPAEISAGIAADTQAPAAEQTIFAMPIGRVLGFGLLNFSLIFVAVAFGALQYLDDLGIVDFGRLVEAGRGQGAGLLTLRTALILLGLLILLGILSGVLRTVARDFGFNLTSGPAGLRRRRGLFTLSEVLIPARRTEAARFDTGWLSGWLGWHGLSFQTLGADAKDGGVQAAAPFARPDEVARVLAEAGFPPLPTGAMTRPPARALVRHCAPWLLAAAAAAIAASLWLPAWYGVAAAALMAIAGLLRWMRAGHLVDERALYIRSGLLSRRLWIIPHDKLQVLETRRSLLQRLLGLASLVPDTAGASAFGAPVVADLPRTAADALAIRLLGDFYTARTRVRAERHRHEAFVEPAAALA